ncbi:DUF6343 family protein [Kribbella sp. NPDC026611]|uniref:DUF6343 family protein n=1 Tax=Kribbella sp. NPDC026611 TaxID=3154911 RepID=UPI0033C73503
MAFEPPPPRSALTLRIVLSVFGVLLFAASTLLSVVFELPAGWIITFAALGLVAVVDLIVVAWRKHSENG